jgi:dienelactone hydrolase
MLKKRLKIIAIGFMLGMMHLMPNAEHHPFIAEKVIMQMKEKDTNKKNNEKENAMRYEFPKLTGNYNLGLTSRHVIDHARKDILDPSANRELMVEIWYPAQTNSSHDLEVYCKDEVGLVKKSFEQMGYPEKDVAMIDQVYVHAISEATPLKESKPFPIILFSHGYLGCDAKMYTAFCEELASHGYIVASIAHTHYATKVTFPDGRVITPMPEKLTHQTMPSEQEQKLWNDDVQTVLNYLETCNKDPKDIFYGMLDMQRVGMVGHSMGGATAYNMCLKDNRFKAGISLDAFPMINNSSTAFSATEMKHPFEIVLAQDTIDNLYATDEELARRTGLPIEQIIQMRDTNQVMFMNMKKYYKELQESKKITYMLIPGIKHGGFSDLMILKEFPFYKNNKDVINLETMTGDANGFETIDRINQAMVKFFKQNL